MTSRGARSMSGIVASVVIGALLAARHPALLAAHHADPTFAKDVAPILYRNCTTCHHAGGMGPFPLIEYDSAKSNAEEIREKVSTGEMPPWHAAGPRGVFTNDRRLSDADRQTILRWIDGGAKPGDLSETPPRPSYDDGWTIGTPDLIVGMNEDFPVPAAGAVEYQYFEIPVPIAEDRWVSAIEIKPGAREVVHHVLVYARPPAGGAAAPFALERNSAHATPTRAPRTDAHAPPRVVGALIATETPGNEVMQFPVGTALRLRAGTTLIFQMHYTAHGRATNDRTRVGFRFANSTPAEEIFASHFFNGALVIPAGAKNVAIPAEVTARQPIRVWGLMPHTHLRGTGWRYVLERPDSTTSIVLDVPRYDFNWQTYYMFATPIEVPAGGRILSTAWYDNSPSNKNNPDPTIEVRWGDQTWEEMQYTGILYSVPRSRAP